MDFKRERKSMFLIVICSLIITISSCSVLGVETTESSNVSNEGITKSDVIYIDDNYFISFSFKASLNTDLSEDIIGVIDGRGEITLTIPYSVDLTSLVASTMINGFKLYVDGVVQKSGTTTNDFSSSITYDVEACNGEINSYSINIRILPSEKYELRNLIEDGFDLSRVDTSLITDMSALFYNRTGFNEDISNWDVRNVTDMSDMFFGALSFNQDISNWKVNNVTNMSSMFWGATSFNQDLFEWETINLSNVTYMFTDAYCFNGDISTWDVRHITDMTGMFFNAKEFNQDISKWEVDDVENMSYMFCGATNFNQDISSWKVGNVTNMASLFCRATNFNQDISFWNVENVTNMEWMFGGMQVFNQDLSIWSNLIAETIDHEGFNGMYLLKEYFPYESWCQY